MEQKYFLVSQCFFLVKTAENKKIFQLLVNCSKKFSCCSRRIMIRLSRANPANTLSMVLWEFINILTDYWNDKPI